MTDKMTPTECLRKLLDERGVEWTYADGTVSFNDGKHWYHAWAYNDGAIVVSMGYLTPEQAVEATLGRGTCKMKRVEDEQRILHGWLECSECGPVYPPVSDRIAQAVAFCPFCGRKVVE